MQGSIMSYINFMRFANGVKLLLHPLEIPNKNWKVVNMNFAFGLTPFTHSYDAIFAYVYKLSKMTHFYANHDTYYC